MFAIIRHAGYTISSGSLTGEGLEAARSLAENLAAYPGWKEVRVSPTARTEETGHAISDKLRVTMIADDRLGMDGDLSDLMPPTEPHGLIFVSHLPIITKYMAKWAKRMNLDEPGMTEIACGWLIDTDAHTIKPLKP